MAANVSAFCCSWLLRGAFGNHAQWRVENRVYFTPQTLKLARFAGNSVPHFQSELVTVAVAASAARSLPTFRNIHAVNIGVKIAVTITEAAT